MRQHTWKAPLCDIQMHIPHYITHPSASPCPNIRYRRCLPMASICPSAHMPPSSSYQVRYPTIYRASTQDALKHISCPTVGGALHVSSAIVARCAAGRGRKRQGAGCALAIQSKRGPPKQPMGVANLGIGKPILLQGKQAPLVLLIRLAENPASFFL